MKRKDIANAFRATLEQNHAIADALAKAGFPLSDFNRLQAWQRLRLMRTYADFRADEQHRAAIRFFLTELYGGQGFRARDQQVARVYPIMVRLLPRPALTAITDALQLQALSLSLDMRMAEQLAEQRWAGLNGLQYRQIYRQLGQYDQRLAQIAMIESLGLRLNKLVRQNRVLRLVKLLRAPAVAAGFSELQSFLENGLIAFREMDDAADFVQAIVARENRFHRRLISDAGPAGESPGWLDVEV